MSGTTGGGTTGGKENTGLDKAKRENPRGAAALLRSALTSEKCGLIKNTPRE